jgi:integrase
MSGEGSIYRRGSDGRWVATISRGPRGARQITTRYCRTRVEARVALDDLRARYGPVSAQRLTVGAFLEQWVRDARNIRDTTRNGYRAAIVTHLLPTIGAIRLGELSPLHVEAMLAELAPRMSPKTLRNVHVVLRRALGQAVRQGLVVRNVADRAFVDPPRVTLGEPDALTHAEEARIRAVLPDHPLGAHVLVALDTGLRQGEQLGLAWEDVDLEAGVIRVRKELARQDGKYVRAEPKSERSKRAVPLTPAALIAFRQHRERLAERGFVTVSTGPVFVNSKGGPLSGSWLTHRWYDLLAQADVPRRPWKVLRATFGTRLHERGVPDRIIADLLGHARSHTTQRHYVSTGLVSAEEAIRRLAG